MMLHNLTDGKFVKQFPLAMGSVAGYSGKRYHTEMFYSFVSFLTPGIFYHCDMTTEDLISTVCYGMKWTNEWTNKMKERTNKMNGWMNEWMIGDDWMFCRYLGRRKSKGLMRCCLKPSRCFIPVRMALKSPCTSFTGRWGINSLCLLLNLLKFHSSMSYSFGKKRRRESSLVFLFFLFL